jgi:hypothetical protein
MTKKPNTRIIHTSFTDTNNETSKWALDDTKKVLVVPKSGTMSNVPVFQEIEQLRNNKHTFIMELFIVYNFTFVWDQRVH